MMFKEGDKVVYVGNSEYDGAFIIGSLHTIIQVEKVGRHISDILLSDLYWYNSEDFKLYLEYNKLWDEC